MSRATHQGKEFESADVQFLVAAQSIVQTAFAFREGGRIENDQVEILFRFFGPAEELENILFDPANRQTVARRILLRGANALRACFHADDFARAGAAQAKRERSLVCETIEDAPPFGVLGDERVIWQLIEIKAGLLRDAEGRS